MDVEIIRGDELSSFEGLLRGYEPGINKICVGAWASFDEPIGIVVLEAMEESIVVDYIYVDEAHRNQKVATGIIEEIKKIAADKKAKILTGDFAAKESYSAELMEFFVAIGAETRYVRAPFYELSFEDIEGALEEKNISFDEENMEIKTLRQMPDMLLKSMIEKEEKEGNFLVSRYDYLYADPDRSFYLKQDGEVAFLLITEAGEDATHLTIPILWSKNAKSAGLMVFLMGAISRAKEASLPTEAVRMDLVSPESYKFATHIFSKDRLQFTESITWWMTI